MPRKVKKSGKTKQGSAGAKSSGKVKQKKEKKEKIQSKKIKKQKEVKNQKNGNLKSTQAEKKRRIKKRIEDFNKFHQEREAELAKRKKKLKKKISLKKKIVKKAISELKKFTENNKEKNPLLETEDGFVYIEITLNKLPETFSLRPFQIALPKPIYSSEYFSKFCIFARDPARDLEDKIEDFDIPCVGKVSLKKINCI